MNTRTVTLLVVGILIGGLIVACSTKRDPDILPASHAQPAEGGGQAPPGIKKDVKISFDVVASYPGGARVFEDWPVVKEVKGNWVLVGFTPTEVGAKAGWKYMEYWVNFNTVVHYRTKQ